MNTGCTNLQSLAIGWECCIACIEVSPDYRMKINCVYTVYNTIVVKKITCFKRNVMFWRFFMYSLYNLLYIFKSIIFDYLYKYSVFNPDEDVEHRSLLA